MGQSSHPLLICHGTLGKSLLGFKPVSLSAIFKYDNMLASSFRLNVRKQRKLEKLGKVLKLHHLHSAPNPGLPFQVESRLAGCLCPLWGTPNPQQLLKGCSPKRK